MRSITFSTYPPPLNASPGSASIKRIQARDASKAPSGPRSSDSFLDRRGHGNKSIDFCEFEKLKNIGTHPDSDHAYTSGARADEVTDDQPETGRVERRNVGEIEDVQ